MLNYNQISKITVVLMTSVIFACGLGSRAKPDNSDEENIRGAREGVGYSEDYGVLKVDTPVYDPTLKGSLYQAVAALSLDDLKKNEKLEILFKTSNFKYASATDISFYVHNVFRVNDKNINLSYPMLDMPVMALNNLTPSIVVPTSEIISAVELLNTSILPNSAQGDNQKFLVVFFYSKGHLMNRVISIELIK